MKHIITFDYELFFGSDSGSVDNCILRPTERLETLLNSYNIKATFFVDVGYLVRAEELKCDLDSINNVKAQIQQLHLDGHDIQLHIHPHWQESTWEQGKWYFNLSKYKLSDFSIEEAAKIIRRYSSALRDLIDVHPVAFRAGGWCIQPFSHFSSALYEAGIRIDSTVYIGGKNASAIQGFDFHDAPSLPYWRFENDPLEVDSKGSFIELPISSASINPLFFWRLAIIRMLGRKRHSSFGDGSAVSMSRMQLKHLLTRPSSSVASIDGYKSRLLPYFRRQHAALFGKQAPFVLIGHPKSTSPYSFSKLKAYLDDTYQNDEYVTLRKWYESIC